jgi:hypothetical protein
MRMIHHETIKNKKKKKQECETEYGYL